MDLVEPDYEKEPLSIHETTAYEVYDPWRAEVRAVFWNIDDAEAFRDRVHKKSKKKKKTG